MSENHQNQRSPHGVTGDTVQQAADVSKPTTDVGRVLDDPAVPQAPADRKPGAVLRESGGPVGNASGNSASD